MALDKASDLRPANAAGSMPDGSDTQTQTVGMGLGALVLLADYSIRIVPKEGFSYS